LKSAIIIGAANRKIFTKEKFCKMFAAPMPTQLKVAYSISWSKRKWK
jgi:hypothetical protein